MNPCWMDERKGEKKPMIKGKTSSVHIIQDRTSRPYVLAHSCTTEPSEKGPCWREKDEGARKDIAERYRNIYLQTMEKEAIS